MWLFGIAAGFSLLIAILMPATSAERQTVDDFAIAVVFIALAVGLFGSMLIVQANEGLPLINVLSVMLLWVMGLLVASFFLTFVFTDPQGEREYAIGAICGLPALLMPLMAIFLYRHEAQQAMTAHPFDDPAAQVNELKSSLPSIVPARLALLLGVVLIIIVGFDLWVAIFEPFAPR